jgi:hypothetical protein
MRDHKLGDAQRAWEVIRPLLSLLLWLLPEHIVIPSSAADKAADTVGTQSSVMGGSSGTHVTPQGTAARIKYAKEVAPVSAGCICVPAHQLYVVSARPSTHC